MADDDWVVFHPDGESEADFGEDGGVVFIGENFAEFFGDFFLVSEIGFGREVSQAGDGFGDTFFVYGVKFGEVCGKESGGIGVVEGFVFLVSSGRGSAGVEF